MSNSDYRDWDRVYREYPLEELPWELGKPRRNLVDLVESSQIKPGEALDICCGAGTNPIYLAQKGFAVTALDISRKAIEIAKQKTSRARVEIQFVLGNFVTLPFKDAEFNFLLDMGCFHHVTIDDRKPFIQGIYRVLKPADGKYLLICFSDKNGLGWNHFSKEQLVDYFSRQFVFLSVEHFGSVEADGYRRYFYSILMQRRDKPCLEGHLRNIF
jgi:ubiquinone/menaquinone biosynthesis C-methylase UbiE